MRLSQLYPKKVATAVRQIAKYQPNFIRAADPHRLKTFAQKIIDLNIECNIFWNDMKPVLFGTPDQKFWIWKVYDKDTVLLTNGKDDLTEQQWISQYESCKHNNNSYHICL